MSFNQEDEVTGSIPRANLLIFSGFLSRVLDGPAQLCVVSSCSATQAAYRRSRRRWRTFIKTILPIIMNGYGVVDVFSGLYQSKSDKFLDNILSRKERETWTLDSSFKNQPIFGVVTCKCVHKDEKSIITSSE